MIVRRISPPRPLWTRSATDFDQMRRDMYRLFDALADARETLPTAGVFPLMNVTQDADNFYVRAEMPCVKADDLDISAVNRTLTIAGRREMPEEEGVSFHRKERTAGQFNRSITLPSEIDNERIEASYKNGLLTVTLAKPEIAKPRQITVKTS